MILLDLENYGITREIFSYFTVRDILSIFHSNKDIQNLCNIINKVVHHVIKVKPLGMLLPEYDKVIILKNMINIFPKISNLSFSNDNSGYWYTMNEQSLKVLSDCHSFSENLKCLAVSISTSEAMSIITNFTSLTSLDLTNSFIVSNHMMSYLSNLTTNITSLNLSRCDELTSAGLRHISSVVNLTSLNLTSCRRINDLGLFYISSLTNLRELNLRYCSSIISNEGLCQLSLLTNLTLLNLYGFHILRDNMLLKLCSSLTNLTELNLNHCKSITDNGLLNMNSLIKLSSLDLTYCFNITGNNGFSELSSLTQLTNLNISDTIINNDGLNKLSTLINLTVLDISGIIIINIIYIYYHNHYNDYSYCSIIMINNY